MPVACINDINVHYVVHGDGPPLLLLHGLGSSVADWEGQIGDLSQHYQVIAPDLRGFGASDAPDGPYSVRQFADDAAGLLDHVQIESAHVLGFSMGGAVAFQLAVDRAARVRSLIIVNSQPSFAVDGWRKHVMVLTRIGMARIFGMRKMVRFLAKRLFPLSEQNDLREKYVARHEKNDRRAYLAAIDALRGWSVVDSLGDLKVPVLMLAADNDYTPMEEKRRYVPLMPNARLAVIRDSRHASHIDQPARFNALVLDFLRSLDPATASPDAAEPVSRRRG